MAYVLSLICNHSRVSFVFAHFDFALLRISAGLFK
jgi:hypothetical protein